MRRSASSTPRRSASRTPRRRGASTVSLAPAAASASSRWPALAAWERTAILVVLWIEILSNVGNGVACVFSPSTALAPLSASPPGPVGAEVLRWFGAMNLVVGYVLARSLAHPAALQPLLEGLCVGDVVYCASLVPFTREHGVLPGIVAPYALTAVMFVARLRYLLGERWGEGPEPLTFFSRAPAGGALAAALDAPDERR